MAAPALHRALKRKLRKLRQLISDPGDIIRRKHTIHRLRVQLKEWRAALRLLHSINPNFPQVFISQDFKPVFAAAGHVRFWQLQRSFLNHTNPLAQAFIRDYRAYLRDRLREAREDFRVVADISDWPRWRELKLDVRQVCEACNDELLQEYFAGLQSAIMTKKTLLSRRRKHEMHALRKLMREYSANRKLLARGLGFDIGPVPGLALDVAGLQESLGDWHDQSAACTQLAEDLSDSAWVAEPLKQGKAVLRAWKKTEREIWDKIIAELASN